MQLTRKPLREAEETLNKLNVIKAKLTEEYNHQVKLTEGQKVGAKKRKVLSRLATEERGPQEHYKFLHDTLLHSLKKTDAAEAAADKEKDKPGDN